MHNASSLPALFRCRATVVWLGFVGATVTSWWLGSHEPGTTAGVLVLAIGCLKGGFVGWDFMELRHAPSWLRLLFGTWLTVVFVLLTGFFLAAGLS